MTVPVPIHFLVIWFQLSSLLIEYVALNDKEVVAVLLTLLLVFALAHGKNHFFLLD